MRHSIVLRATTLALVLGWAQSQAAEGEYPAAHFEPEVVYQAAETAPAPESPAADDTDYPAAHFEPKVIYQDPELIETVRAQPVQPPAAAPVEPARPRTTAPKTEAPGGPVSDVTPPYGMLAFALGVIGLAFWWSSRTKTPAAGENAEDDDVEVAMETAEAAAAPDDDAGEAEEDDLEALAEAAVANLAHTNRQRANKTRRTRRR